jgi:hypothetical protein
MPKNKPNEKSQLYGNVQIPAKYPYRIAMTITLAVVFTAIIAKIRVAQQAVDPTSKFPTPRGRAKNPELRRPTRLATLNITSYDRESNFCLI